MSVCLSVRLSSRYGTCSSWTSQSPDLDRQMDGEMVTRWADCVADRIEQVLPSISWLKPMGARSDYIRRYEVGREPREPREQGINQIP